MEKLIKRIVDFRDAREWAPFHKLKNLASALSVEASELLELTQWKSDDELESELCDEPFRSNLSSEIADTLIYLLLICEKAGIDPLAAAYQKIELNEKRYPVEKARGSSIKYSDLK